MYKILALVMLFFVSNSVLAQKYKDRYISEATKVADNWCNAVQKSDFESAYTSLTTNNKDNYKKDEWIGYMKNLQNDFGVLKSRDCDSSYFSNSYEGIGDGFFVIIKFDVDYYNTNNHFEQLVLEQDEKMQWKVLDFSYSTIINSEDNDPLNIEQ